MRPPPGAAGVGLALLALAAAALLADANTTPTAHPVVTRTGSWPTAFNTVYPTPERTHP